MFFISKPKFMLGIGGNGKAKPDSVCVGGDLISAAFPSWTAVGDAVPTNEGVVGLFLGPGVIGGGMRASTCRINAGGYRGIREGMMWGGSRAKVINSSGKFTVNLSRRGLSLACKGCNDIP